MVESSSDNLNNVISLPRPPERLTPAEDWEVYCGNEAEALDFFLHYGAMPSRQDSKKVGEFVDTFLGDTPHKDRDFEKIRKMLVEMTYSEGNKAYCDDKYDQLREVDPIFQTIAVAIRASRDHSKQVPVERKALNHLIYLRAAVLGKRSKGYDDRYIKEDIKWSDIVERLSKPLHLPESQIAKSVLRLVRDDT